MTLEHRRRKWRDDPHRPLYHFLPPANWINDPNGLIQWRGRYHLFYQYNPDGPFHDAIRWGHAASEDLVHWTDLPVALTPTPGGPDKDGCYSGCVVDNNGVPTLVYTGVDGEEQLPCLATSCEDELINWKKYERNPVIPAPPEELEVTGFRDHCVWRENDLWYQAIGAGIESVGGAVLLYKSQDLAAWEYLHPLYVREETRTDPVWTGTMWECPDFFALGDKHVLVVSVFDGENPHYTVYFLGSYADHEFFPERLEIIDTGGCFYAPQTLLDDRGQRIMWGWIRERRQEPAVSQAGWAGTLSLPRLLAIRPDGELCMKPAPELKNLRNRHQRFENIEVAPRIFGMLEGLRGDCLEILAEFEVQDAETVGLKVRRSSNGEEETRIIYDRRRQRLGLDTTRSSLDTSVSRDVRWVSLDLPSGETLKLHVFLDRSVIEVFANYRRCLTGRTYPTLQDSVGFDLFSSGGRAKLKALDSWQMSPIWTDSTEPEAGDAG